MATSVSMLSHSTQCVQVKSLCDVGVTAVHVVASTDFDAVVNTDLV